MTRERRMPLPTEVPAGCSAQAVASARRTLEDAIELLIRLHELTGPGLSVTEVQGVLLLVEGRLWRGLESLPARDVCCAAPPRGQTH